MSKYGVFSGPYFPVFGLNTKIYYLDTFYTVFLYHNLQFRLPILSSLLFILLNQKQSSGAVLQKRCSYKFHRIHKKTPKKRFRYRRFLVNSAKFPITSFLKDVLDGCFSINTRYVYCPTLTFCLFKNDVTHIFWLNIFSV